MMKKVLLSLMLALAAGSAAADETAEPPKDLSYVPQAARTLYDNARPQDLTEQQKNAMALAKIISREAKAQAAQATSLVDMNALRGIKDRSGQMQNAALEDERKKVLDFLGFKPGMQHSHLYYFVSFSMPDALLKTYVQQAMWDGGELIIRGMPEGMTIGQFIKKQMATLIKNKGASATIRIDPRLYDAYGIDKAPTIVYTEAEQGQMCAQPTETAFEYDKEHLAYKSCSELDDSKFWKMEGAVSSDYALREFVKKGATGAQVYLDALAHGGLAGGGKVQAGFKGDWDKMVTPAELLAVKKMVSKVFPGQEAYETPLGMSIGKPGMEDKKAGITKMTFPDDTQPASKSQE